ncbi:MAG: YggS family pyridoxal phosphate-dependent enzyme [Oscillospiraceae bacterium]|nr:YggS family pyridoxal phosphate-dependent enzyme [Oscillospiraceae bacterium]
MSIAENVKIVRDRIAEAAIRSGRRPEDILLVAATKMNDAERVREAIRAGVDASGENRVQELVEKHALGAYEGAPLHFIGHLQTNKINKVTGVCDLIQSVDSEELVRLIGRRAVSLGITQDILIEVNIAGEVQKSGVSPAELDRILDFASQTEGVFVKGLMTVPPVQENSEKNIIFFESMRRLFVDMSGKKRDNVDMCILSMGMSADYEIAVAAGANMVRVGSAIFGARHYT